VSRAPDGILVSRDRDLDGRESEVWVRRSLFALLPVVAVLALANVFGQRPETRTASTASATLGLHAPARVRSGLLFGARITVAAKTDIANARLVLDPGWFEGLTVNTIEPAPKDETSVDGKTALTLGPIAAGHEHVTWIEFQVNPTNVGHRSQRVRLYDGRSLLARIDRTITVFP
jgi:hypothetical protein